VRDAHPQERIAELLGCLACNVYLAEIVRKDGAFTGDYTGADVWVRGLRCEWG
jgi:hypothetical protein